ncbi:hypothetical protein [Streptomyces sp. KL116D]|uniref:hypothetical protein n=1 Tax=Streptomyces sp. KL116D TaxID=3045152 RepID=UPI003556F2C7
MTFGTAVEHHALGLLLVCRNAETTLRLPERTGLLLALAGTDDLAEALGLLLEVEGLQALLQRCGTIDPSKYVPKRSRSSR